MTMSMNHPRLASLDPLKGATRCGPAKPVPPRSGLRHFAPDTLGLDLGARTVAHS
jgi:hypothetical protein